MRRLFFSLYAVVAAALAGFVVAIPWLVGNVLRGELQRGGEQVAIAAQGLFEQELRILPADRWPAHMQELQSRFGYDLALLRLGEVKVSKQSMRRLQQGRVVLPDNDRMDFMLLPIRGSDYVVRTYLVQQDRERAQRTMEGFYYLVEKQLAEYPAAKRADALRDVEGRLGITLRSMALSDVIDEGDRDRLRAGEIVGKDTEGRDERYFKRMDEGEQILQIGPFPHYFLENSIQYLAWLTLAITIAIALYLWVRPLWRDMLALDQGALAIGMGQMDARVQVSVRSPVRALANTFNGMAQRVQELLKSQKEMADAVSHELCTPISRLRFGVEMLGNTPAGTDYDRYMRGILRDIEELEGLVDEALTYSRLTHSAVRLSMQEVDLTDWLRDVMRDTQRSAGAINLSSEITTASASANFDAQFMARALSNIIRNSLRYARTTVKVTINESADHLDLVVEDDGPGIPQDQRATIFEPFYRIDRSRQRGSGGHGLGLAIVKRICEWHGAETLVEDSVLGGALFRLRLPWIADPE